MEEVTNERNNICFMVICISRGIESWCLLTHHYIPSTSGTLHLTASVTHSVTRTRWVLRITNFRQWLEENIVLCKLTLWNFWSLPISCLYILIGNFLVLILILWNFIWYFLAILAFNSKGEDAKCLCVLLIVYMTTGVSSTWTAVFPSPITVKPR